MLMAHSLMWVTPFHLIFIFPPIWEYLLALVYKETSFLLFWSCNFIIMRQFYYHHYLELSCNFLEDLEHSYEKIMTSYATVMIDIFWSFLGDLEISCMFMIIWIFCSLDVLVKTKANVHMRATTSNLWRSLHIDDRKLWVNSWDFAISWCYFEGFWG